MRFCCRPSVTKSTPAPQGNAAKKRRNKGTATGKNDGTVRDGDSNGTATVSDKEGGDDMAWDMELLDGVISAVEEEIVTLRPAPIGLRLHLADLWLEEAFAAGGENMPTDVLVAILAPWLRSAVDPNTNTVVFKRTVEGVFKGLLRYFPEGGDATDDGMDTGELQDTYAFKKVELSAVQACLFEAAAAPQVRRFVQMYLFSVCGEMLAYK